MTGSHILDRRTEQRHSADIICPNDFSDVGEGDAEVGGPNVSLRNLSTGFSAEFCAGLVRGESSSIASATDVVLRQRSNNRNTYALAQSI